MRQQLAAQECAYIVLFDGVCNLCNATVDTLIKIDRKRQLRYASLQSDFGQSVLSALPERPDSIIFITPYRVYYYGDAVLQIAKVLGFPYNMLGIGQIIPKGIRNWLYKGMAKRRYSWFGKRDSCRMPTAGERKLFIS